MRAILVAMLNDFRSAGKNASRSEMVVVFDEHFPVMIQASDEYLGIAMSAAAKERGLAAMLQAAAASGSAPIASPVRSNRLTWAIAASLALMVALGALWFLRWNNPSDKVAIPSLPPKVTTPDKPQSKGPDLEREDYPIVKEELPSSGSTVPHIPQPEPHKEERVIAEKQPAIGKAGNLEGEPILFSLGSSKPAVLEIGEKITAGSRIETGDGGKAEILLADGSVLRLSFNTSLVAVNEREFELRGGTLFAEVAKTSKKRPFTIRTAAASARVLGTEFGLSVESLGSESQSTVLQVKEGRVEFYNDLDSVVATDMTTSSAVLGTAPTEPRRLNSLTFFGFSGTGTMIEVRTAPLDEEEAAPAYVFPLGSTGFIAGTVPGGDLNIITMTQDASARRAGLRVGDTILALDGQRPTMDSLRRDICLSAGEDIVLRIRRDGTEFDVTVPVEYEDSTVADLPATIASQLFAATRPALDGDTELSRQRLEALSKQVRHPAVLNNLGVVYQRLDMMGPAIRSYQEAVTADKKNDLYRRNLAGVLLNIGNFKRAVEEREIAYDLDPDDLSNILGLVGIYQIARRGDDALALLDESLAQAPRAVELWIAKSSTLLALNKMDEAIESALKATQIAPDNAVAQWRLGLGYSFTGRYQEAEIAFAKTIELDPCIATYYNSRAINLTDLGRLEEAEAEYRKGVKLDPDFIPVRIGLGIVLGQIGRSEEAEKVLRKTIDMDPQNRFVHYHLSWVLKNQGLLVEAEEMIRKAISLGFVSPHQHCEHAEILAALGRFDDSVAVYEREVSANPGDAHLRAKIGWRQIEMRRWADAVKNLRRGIELDSTSPYGVASRINLGFALINEGLLDEAEKVISEARTLDSTNAEVSSNYALLLARKGINLDEALKGAQSAAVPDAYAQMFHTLGYVHYRRGEYDEAIVALTKAADGYGNVYLAADALFVLGQVYEAKNDVTSAIATYKRAVAIDRGHKEAAVAIKRLGG